MGKSFASYQTPAAWRTDDFPDPTWMDVLTEEEQRELLAAAHALPEDENAWLEKSPSDFELPSLKKRLGGINRELEDGRGFAVLRGVPLSPSDVDFAYRANWILALGLGQVIAQNAAGEVIGAVEALVEATDNGIDTRGYVSNAELRFHCDGGDVASLLCVRQAPQGGFNSLASMITVHNTMVQECPHHLETLYRGLSMYMRKEGNLESAEMARQPLFMPSGQKLLAWCNLRLMELPYEAAGKPMPEDERAALSALEEIAERPENVLSIKLSPGDMLLTHNFLCMHKRSGFTDHPAPEKKRLMLRLWYNIEGGHVEAIQPPSQRSGYFTQAPYVIRNADGQP